MERVYRGINMNFKLSILYILSFHIWLNPNVTWATTYHCETTEKYDFGIVYSKEQIDKWKYSVRVEELTNETNVYRCSLSIIENGVTCDKYEIDKVEFDTNINLKKYYYFRGQYNFQIFSDLNSLEDNGRGSVQYGKCAIQ